VFPKVGVSNKGVNVLIKITLSVEQYLVSGINLKRIHAVFLGYNLP